MLRLITAGNDNSGNLDFKINISKIDARDWNLKKNWWLAQSDEFLLRADKLAEI